MELVQIINKKEPHGSFLVYFLIKHPKFLRVKKQKKTPFGVFFLFKLYAII